MTEDLDAEEPVAALAARLGLVIEGVAPGGEFGAVFVHDSEHRPLVLKVVTGTHRAVRWERGLLLAARLRSGGYPVPEYIGIGVSGELVWSLQQRLSGAVPELLEDVHVASLLDLAQSHVDAAADLDPIGTEEPSLTLSLAGADRLAQIELTAAIGAKAKEVLERGAPRRLRSSDVCHGDFHHRNLLANGDEVTGVFDWEGAGCGDWRFDVATLAFWCTVAVQQVDERARARARTRAEEVCEPPVLAYFTAALTTRLLSFYLSAHPEFLDVVLPAIREGIVPWWHDGANAS